MKLSTGFSSYESPKLFFHNSAFEVEVSFSLRGPERPGVAVPVFQILSGADWSEDLLHRQEVVFP
ncbi:MAG: hypothetical protein DWH78_14115 [Planctomycetota bacterium]|nr:MAG: hypothetical protein DWH78_14115 [Planctomycetota bacterium]